MKYFHRDYAIKGIRGNKKHFIGIILVLFFSFFLLEVTFVFGDSIVTTAKEVRFDRYGSFRFSYRADDNGIDMMKMREAQEIQRLGTITSYGEAKGQEIGFIDEEGQQLGRIICTKGMLPSSDWEFAAEASTLKVLGYTDEIGQEIILPITVFTAGNIEKTVYKPYTLCGIIQEYTAAWEFGPSIFITEFAGAALLKETLGGISQQTYLIDADENFWNNYREYGLWKLPKINEKAYPEENLQNTSTVVTYSVVMISIIGLGVLISVMILSVRKRKDTWRTLRAIGADKLTIQKTALWEGLLLGGIFIPAGILAALLFSAISVAVINLFTNARILLTIVIQHILIVAGIGVGIGVFGAFTTSFSIRNIPMITVDKKSRPKKDARKDVPIKKVSALHLIRFRIKGQKLLSVSLFIVICSCCLVIGFWLNSLSYHIDTYNTMRQEMQHGDVVLTNHLEDAFGLDLPSVTGGHENYGLRGIDEALLEEITGLYGIDSIYRYRYSTVSNTRSDYIADLASSSYGGNARGFKLDLSQYNDSEYYRLVEKNERATIAKHYEADFVSNTAGDSPGLFYSDSVSYTSKPVNAAMQQAKQWTEFDLYADKYPTSLMGLPTNQEAQRFIQALDEGTYNKERFFSGDECIIVLPNIYAEPVHSLVSMKDDILYGDYDIDVGWNYHMKSGLFDESLGSYTLQGYTVYREEAIQIGDMLKLSFSGETHTITVAGIIRTMPKNTGYYPNVDAPYTIITGEAFLQQFSTYSRGMDYDCLTIELMEGVDHNAFTKQLRLLANKNLSGIFYLHSPINDLALYESEMISNIGFLSLFTMLYLALAFVILSILFGISVTANRKRLSVFKAIGMDNRLLRRSYLLECLFTVAGGAIGGILVLLAVWSYEQYQKMWFKGTMLSYIFTEGSCIFMWALYWIFILLIFFTLLLLYYVPLRKSIHESIISQMQ